VPFVCRKCGARGHEDDVEKHVCNPADIPQKGEVIRIDGTKELISN